MICSLRAFRLKPDDDDDDDDNNDYDDVLQYMYQLISMNHGCHDSFSHHQQKLFGTSLDGNNLAN